MKMNKEQRNIISKMVCDAFAKKVENNNKKIFKDFDLKANVRCYYNEAVFKIDLTDSQCRSHNPAYIKLAKTLFNKKEYTVTFYNGYLNVKFNKKAEQLLNNALNPKRIVEDIIDNFNDKMKTEFMLQTSFNDITDINKFIKEFVKSI